MANKIYIVHDMNDGIPLWAFYSLRAAAEYQLQSEEQYPETEIIECDLD